MGKLPTNGLLLALGLLLLWAAVTDRIKYVPGAYQFLKTGSADGSTTVVASGTGASSGSAASSVPGAAAIPNFIAAPSSFDVAKFITEATAGA